MLILAIKYVVKKVVSNGTGYANASVGDVSLISSPLVDATKEWLSARALTLGNMLASERAVEYVAILRALAAFRAEHEPEPLHEDVERKVCGDAAEASASATFKGDIHQLKEWNLVTERIIPLSDVR